MRALHKLPIVESGYSNFQTTVKAPNYGPHGHFGPLFQKRLLSLKHILQKNEWNKSCRKTLDLQICFCFWNMIHPNKLGKLQKRSEVSMRSKVRGFGGIWFDTILIIGIWIGNARARGRKLGISYGEHALLR